MALGDFNGDGYPDLAVGAPGEDVDGNADAGAVYLYLGTERGFEPWHVLHGKNLTIAPGLGFGTALAAGDIDENGDADLVVAYGAHSSTQLFEVWSDAWVYQKAGLDVSGPGVLLADVDADGQSPSNSEFGAALRLADFDGDGHIDLAVGAPGQYSVADSADTGAAYILYGNGVYLDGYSAQRLLPSDLVTASSGMRFGEVLDVGDVTSDGTLDVLVGLAAQAEVLAYQSGTGGFGVFTYAGKTGLGDSVLVGNPGGGPAVLAGGTGTTTVSAFTGIDLGGGYTPLDSSLQGSPMGFADLKVPSTEQLLFATTDSPAGSLPVVGVADLGATLTPSFYLGPSVPREASDGFGQRVIVADYDGDARTDVIVGAPSVSGAGAGRVYVFSVTDASQWADPEYWSSVWAAAGYTSSGNPTYEDPMPVQVVTQETTPGNCDRCAVLQLADGELCGDLMGADICLSSACFTRTGCGDGYRGAGAGDHGVAARRLRRREHERRRRVLELLHTDAVRRVVDRRRRRVSSGASAGRGRGPHHRRRPGRLHGRSR